MKKSLFLFAGLLFMAISTESVKAQSSATATVNAAAKIISPISIEKTGDLNFGVIASSSTAGTVTVSPEVETTTSGGVTLFSSVLPAPSVPTFELSGVANAQFSVLLPDNVSLTSGSNTMAVSLFTASVANLTGELSSEGTATFTVGATLAVAANQAAGEYNGTFDVTVSYE